MRKGSCSHPDVRCRLRNFVLHYPNRCAAGQACRMPCRQIDQKTDERAALMKFWDASAIIPLLADEPSRQSLLAVLDEDPEMLAWWGTPVEIMSALARRE